MRHRTEHEKNLRFSRRETLLSMLSLGLGGFANSAAATSPRAAESAETSSMRILCFNTHLLPAIAQKVAGHRGQADYRAEAIARQLNQYHLIGLCEVFESKRRQQIVETLQRATDQAYQVVESPGSSGRHLIGGGLLLLSRFPIEGKPNTLTYRDASRFLRSGFKADGFAAKGAIHARLQIIEEPLVLVDCFLTHLESHSPQARQNQIKELAGFVAAHSSVERPMILLGDLNVTADFPANEGAGDSENRLLTDLLRHGKRPLVDVWSSLEDERGGTSDAIAGESSDRIDYIFMSSSTGYAKAALMPTAAKVVPFLDKEVKEGSLSDHAGIECQAMLAVR